MKTNNNTTNSLSGRMHTRVRNTLGSLAAIAFLAPLTAGEDHHGARAFSKIVSFGDSLSDTGNFYRATGVPPFPYWEGRASDGPLWVEHLAAKLRIPLDPADNYAWLGSMTGNTNYRDMPEANIFFPGFEQQIGAFLQEVDGEGADPRALYTVWIGANDFFDWLVKQNQTPESLVATGVGNTVEGIVALAQAGARHFVVGNLPDLGITPDIRALGPAVAGSVSYLAAAYNAALEEQLTALEAGLGIHITRLDAFGILNQIAAEPAVFGLTNVTDAAIASYPVADPSEYLFWDGVHPTTATNAWTADFVCAELVKTYAPKKARGHGPRNTLALHGLVRAAQCRN